MALSNDFSLSTYCVHVLHLNPLCRLLLKFMMYSQILLPTIIIADHAQDCVWDLTTVGKGSGVRDYGYTYLQHMYLLNWSALAEILICIKLASCTWYYLYSYVVVIKNR